MIISSKKYACETCIKGHRSSACKHTDRPLFEIKKKGRPVTQCEHCRELRKTKQVHVKCLCEAKADSSAHQQGPKQGFESAAFPNGLPQALEASVAYQSLAEGTSSDSDHGGVHQGHQCKSGNPCNCVQPRIRNWTRGGSLEQQHLGATASDSLRDPASPSRTSSQILARIAELRPVLPRPTQGGPVHDPSTGTPHGHTSRHHDNKPYQHTPYGVPHQHALTPPSFLPSGNLTTPFAFNEQSSYNSSSQIHMMGGSATDWPPREGDNSEFQSISPSSCGCGDACRCPGCVHHNRTTAAPSSSAYSSCHNPELCMTCLDCTIMSLPSSAVLPLDTALSIYDPQLQNDAIDDWLRQMSFTLPSDNSPSITTGTYPLQSPPTYQQPSPSNWNNQSNYPFPEQQNEADPLSTFNFGLSATQSMMSYSPSTSHTRNASYSAPASRTGHRLHGSLSVPSSGTPVDPRLLGTGVPMNVQQFSNFMSQARSRSPSTSSQSSFHGSDHQGGTAAIPTPPYRPSGRMQGMPTQAQGLRSMPHLDIRPNIHRGPSSGSSASISPSPGSSAASSATRAPYAASNPETRQPDYDPSLAGLQLY
ncbi:hypothetical protein CPC08DRAFT_502688 [Agrocybe pediades]|nr:hypothetical protein CPC08DRAFT_502688 [Agrocybe pediades]